MVKWFQTLRKKIIVAIWNKLNNNEDDSHKTRPKVYSEVRPLVASASRVNLSIQDQVEAIIRLRQAHRWQEDAWEYYDLVGEVKQAATLLANVASRIRLYPSYIVDKDAVPSIIDDVKDIPDSVKEQANAAMMLLATGNGGISGLIRDAAINLFVAGECFLIREPSKLSTGEPEKWQIRSTSEFVKTTYTDKNSGKKITKMAIKETKNAREGSEDYINLPSSAFVGRIWRPHARFSKDPESSLLGVLELLDELLLIDKSSRGVVRSRLNNGIFVIADEIGAVSQSDGEVIEEDGEIADLSDSISEDIEEDLMAALTEPIKNEGSAASVAPVFFRVPAQYIETGLRHISFERTYDPAIAARYEKVIERIMTALDLPKDVMAGFANIKYSNALVVEESLYKAHVEPLILMIVDALTVIFLRPILRGLGVTEDIVARTAIWYDPSGITAKPDKASAANTGYTQQTISGAAWRRENGFSETDAPTQLELAQRMAVTKGLLSEPISEALLKTLIPDVLNQVRADSMANTDPTSADALSSVLDPNAAPATGEVTAESVMPGVEPGNAPPAGGDNENPPSGLIEP